MASRALIAVALLAATFIVMLLVPASQAWLASSVGEPLAAQVDPAAGQRVGYSLPSLAFWAAVGAVLGWAAYDLVFVTLRFEADRAFFAALAPALLLGPLLHAALVVGALPPGPIGYLAAEPVVYLTSAAFALVGLLLGRATRRPLLAPIAWGAVGLVPLLALLAPHLDAQGLQHAALLLALALAPALALAWAYTRWSPRDTFPVVLAVVFAHALDGATTWMVLRDPFGLGFASFGERNPVSEQLVGLSNGWPYFAVKLALPLALLALVKRDETEARLRAFLLLAVFALGFGPGMANLLQVMLG